MTSQAAPPLERLFDLSGRVAFITGAASGFGEAIALGFAGFGCDIVATDVNFEGAQATAAKVCAKGRRALPLAVDVGSPEQIEAGFAAAAAEFGTVDILVNSAGVSPHQPAEHPDINTWDTALDINLRGAFLCCQHAARLMLAKGKGSIINISSIAAHVGFPRGVAIYCASKGGLDALTRQMAVEWARRGIRVNSVAPCQFLTPGLEAVMRDPQFDPEKLMHTWTDNIPMGRIGQPWEIVGPAVFLASDASSMVTGVCLPIDGGYLAR
jgi:NAD(P)-dependent dehydrogenase (short-subunit alcohol dehydrogenase family)